MSTTCTVRLTLRDPTVAVIVAHPSPRAEMLNVPVRRCRVAVAGTDATAGLLLESVMAPSGMAVSLTDAGALPPMTRNWFGTVSEKLVVVLAGWTTTCRRRVRSPSLAVIFAQPAPAPVTTKAPDVEPGAIGTPAGTPTTCGFVLVRPATTTPADA